MTKARTIAYKALSIERPKWFFSLLEQIHERTPKLEVDLSEVQKIHPSGQALIEMLISEAKLLGVTLSFRYSSSAKPFRKGQDLVYPFHHVQFSVHWFTPAIEPSFLETFFEHHQKEFNDDLRFDFQMLFNELTQNAKDHSSSEKYMVFLSPTEVGIFDLGVSIPAKLEQIREYDDDCKAIEDAMVENVTTRRLRKGGLGLTHTLDLVKGRNGFLYIASRRGQIRRYFKNKKIDRKILAPRMPGTLVYCQFSKIAKKGKTK